MGMPRITMSSRVRAVRHQVSSSLGQEAVILELERGIYYGVDEVGSRIWELVERPRTVSDIRDAILGEYDVDAETCAADTLKLLEEMADHGLIEVDPEDGP